MLLEIKRYIRRLLLLIPKEEVRKRAISYYTNRNHTFVTDLNYPFDFQMLDTLTGLPLNVAIANFYPSKGKLRRIQKYPIPKNEKVIFYANAEEHRVFAYSAFSPTELLTVR